MSANQAMRMVTSTQKSSLPKSQEETKPLSSFWVTKARMNWNSRVEAELLHPAQGDWQWCWEALGNCHRDVELHPRKHSSAYHETEAIENRDEYSGLTIMTWECDSEGQLLFGMNVTLGYDSQHWADILGLWLKLDLGVVTWYRGKREATGQAPAHSAHTKTLKNCDFLKKISAWLIPWRSHTMPRTVKRVSFCPRQKPRPQREKSLFHFHWQGDWKSENMQT